MWLAGGGITWKEIGTSDELLGRFSARFKAALDRSRGLMIPGYTEVKMLVSEVEGEKADDNDPGHSIRLFTNMLQDITNRSADLCIRRKLS